MGLDGLDFLVGVQVAPLLFTTYKDPWRVIVVNNTATQLGEDRVICYTLGMPVHRGLRI